MILRVQESELRPTCDAMEALRECHSDSGANSILRLNGGGDDGCALTSGVLIEVASA